MRKILITGGSGLVGSQFKKDAFSSYCNYNWSPPYAFFSSSDCDLRNPEEVNKMFDKK